MSAGPAETTGALLQDIHIGIVGAGIGGLTLALALRRCGFPKVSVFEAGTAAEPPAHALEITANASRVLHALGLEEPLRSHAREPGFSYLRNRRSGFLLIQRPLGDFSESRYGAPTYLLSQATLLGLLRNACSAHGVEQQFETAVADIDPIRGTLTTAADKVHHFSAIVVADGSRSELRPLISTTEQAARQPQPGVITARCGAPTVPDATLTWLDEKFFCIQYPLGENRSDLLLVHAEPEQFGSASADDVLHKLLDDSHHQLVRVLQHLQHADYQPATQPAVASHWFAGKVALLGDACHRLGSFQTQGACLAIEDAWVLATMMERWEEAPSEGFFDYQRYRKPRISKLQMKTSVQLDELIGGTPAANLRRNFRWSLTNRFLPEISMAQLDWLYGYDCVKGFA